MKKAFLIGSSLLFLLVSCDKDSFETKPQIEVKTDGNVIIPVQGGFVVEIDYTDREGDIDNVIVLKKERLNKRTTATIRDTVSLSIPEFPNANKGQIVLTLDYQNHLVSAANPPNVPGSNPPKKESDTLNLKFVLKDKAGNASDTAVLTNVIVLRN